MRKTVSPMPKYNHATGETKTMSEILFKVLTVSGGLSGIAGLIMCWLVYKQFAAEKAERIGKYFEIREDNGALCRAIRERQYPQVILNDMALVSAEEEVQRVREELIAAFESVFPEKSQYEK